MDNLEHGILMEGMFGGPDFGIDLSPEIPSNEVEQFVKTASEQALCGPAVVDRSWDEPVGTVVEKREQVPSTGKTVAQKLGIIKTEVSEPDEDGIRHVRGYNASGELVLYKTLFREVA